jgi:hypothetical protein
VCQTSEPQSLWSLTKLHLNWIQSALVKRDSITLHDSQSVHCPSRWRGSAADQLLRFRVRIQQEIDACHLWVLCNVEVSARRRPLFQSSTDCEVLLCVTYKPQERGGPGPRQAVSPEEIIHALIECVYIHTIVTPPKCIQVLQPSFRINLGAYRDLIAFCLLSALK